MMTEALLSENGGYIRYVDGTIRASNHLIHFRHAGQKTSPDRCANEGPWHRDITEKN